MFIATPNERLKLSSAYLQKELTCNVCADFKLAAGMKSTQRPSFDEENISI